MTNPALLQATLLFVAATALLIATAYDVAARIVPNGVPAVVAAAGTGLNALDGQLAAAVFGSGLVFAVIWQFWRRGWLGGGDVKLLTACTLLVRPASVPELILTTALAGGVLALVYLGAARLLPSTLPPRPSHRLGRIWRAEQRRIRRGLSLPYACAIAAGAVLTLYAPVGFG